MKIYKNYEKGSERHHGICDHCGSMIFPSHRNPYVFFGFLCQDTGMFIYNDCRKDFYTKKNQGIYGKEHAHKYSEMPVPVPWEKYPVRENIQLQLF